VDRRVQTRDNADINQTSSTMAFQIVPLPMSEFRDLFTLSDAELSARRARRLIADVSGGLPCRVSLADALPGETVLLLNYTHLETDTPYRSSHAICVREQAVAAELAPDAVPPAILRRLISARLFDAAGNIIDSDVCEGGGIAAFLTEGLARDDVAFVHLHYARNGCFAAKAVRA
jgi:Protein of unknown function (DUF1203)